MLLIIATALALLSLTLTLWQWAAALRFPIHQRVGDKAFAPGVTLLKPLKGHDAETAPCLRSWLTQDFDGPVEVLFGVASADDPVCGIVRGLIEAHRGRNARLVICTESIGTNPKASTLAQLERLALHDVLVLSDADVHVPPDFLVNVVAPLREAAVGLVNCFYELAHPSVPAMRWEAVAVNADFWSQVLQSRSLRPLDFALGAVMAVRRDALNEIGGCRSVVDFLADDYQLGHLIAARGWRVELCPVVVECREAPRTWRQAWTHQLRWARTIRVCQPVPFFFSILSNATLWPVLLLLIGSRAMAGQRGLSAATKGSLFDVALSVHWLLGLGLVCLLVRIGAAFLLQRRLTRSSAHAAFWWFAPVKDLLGFAIWVLAFIGNKVEWRGVTFRVQRGGKLVRV